jgi:hypothetical protein
MTWLVLSLSVAGLSVRGATPPVIQSASPSPLFVEAGGSQSWLILKGQGLEGVQGLRSRRDGVISTHLLGKPAPGQDGSREFVLLMRPDAPLGPMDVVAVGEGFAVPVPVQLEVVPLGDARAQASGKLGDLSKTAQTSTTSTIVVDRSQVPEVLSTVPRPLMVAPDGQPHQVLLSGKNLQRVTDVRIRKEGDETRYRGRQGQIPFRQVVGGLELDVMAATRTPLGSRYIIDLMVDRFLATSVLLTVGTPPPPVPVPENAPPKGPTVIEIPNRSVAPAESQAP